MIGQLLAKVIGTQNERELKRLQPRVAQISALEPGIQPLSDEQLRGKTAEFRQRVANGEPLDDLLPEAFAVVREAGRRVLNMWTRSSSTPRTDTRRACSTRCVASAASSPTSMSWPVTSRPPKRPRR